MTRIGPLLLLSIWARSGDNLALDAEAPSSETGRGFCANSGFAMKIRASNKKRPPPHAAPWRSLRWFDFFFLCAVIFFLAFAEKAVRYYPPLTVHGRGQSIRRKLLIVEIHAHDVLTENWTLCPLARAVGHFVPCYSGLPCSTQSDHGSG